MFMVTLFSINLIACGLEDVPALTTLEQEFSTGIVNRAEDNKALADQLRSSGLMSKQTYEQINTSLNTTIASYKIMQGEENNKTADSDMLNKIFMAASQLTVLGVEPYEGADAYLAGRLLPSKLGDLVADDNSNKDLDSLSAQVIGNLVLCLDLGFLEYNGKSIDPGSPLRESDKIDKKYKNINTNFHGILGLLTIDGKGNNKKYRDFEDGQSIFSDNSSNKVAQIFNKDTSLKGTLGEFESTDSSEYVMEADYFNEYSTSESTSHMNPVIYEDTKRQSIYRYASGNTTSSEKSVYYFDIKNSGASEKRPYLGDGGIKPLPLMLVGQNDLLYKYDETTGRYSIVTEEVIEGQTGVSGSDIIRQVNEFTNVPIKVLDWQKLIKNGSNTDVNKLALEIKNAVSVAEDPEKRDVSYLESMFKTVYFDAGSTGQSRAVTLLDTMNPDFQVINVTRDVDYDEHTTSCGDDLVIRQQVKGSSTRFSGNTSWDVAHIKLVEFNKRAIDALLDAITGTEQKYFFYHAQSDVDGSTTGGAASCLYLMEYPVAIAENFIDYGTSKVNNEENILIVPRINDSYLAVNVMTGQVAKYESAWNGNVTRISESTGTKAIRTEDSYIKLINSSSTIADSSFMIGGVAVAPILKYKTSDINGNITSIAVNCRIPMVFLKDYMEGIYAPDLVQDENVVTFGRMLRFNSPEFVFFDATSNSQIGTVEDGKMSSVQSGSEPNSSDEITCKEVEGMLTNQSAITNSNVGSQITQNSTDPNTLVSAILVPKKDMMFYVKDGKKSEKYKETLNASDIADFGYLSRLDRVFTLNDAVQSSSNEFEFNSNLSNLVRIENLNVTTYSSINPCLMFGGKGSFSPSNSGSNYEYDMNKADYLQYNDDKKTPFTVIATRNNIFDRGLYNYINSSDEESFEAFRTWLADHEYNYNIDLNTLEEYLNQNYSDKMAQEGVIILNADTIQKVQKMIDNDTAVSNNNMIRTIQIIIGVILIVYALILVICWGIDTHSGLNSNLVERLTLGHWVAVAYSEDEKKIKVGDKAYLGFGKMILRAVILMSVGVVMMFSNFNMIVYSVVEAASGFVNFIEGILKG